MKSGVQLSVDKHVHVYLSGWWRGVSSTGHSAALKGGRHGSLGGLSPQSLQNVENCRWRDV